MSYSQERRDWSDRYIPDIKRIVGPFLLEPTSFEIDTEQAADLIIFKASDMRIAARVRDNKYLSKYPYEFTLRSKSGNNKTELQKIIDGWGDWLFYGFASKDGIGIDRWFIINLSAFRAEIIRRKKKIKFVRKSNGDGTEFVSIDVRSLLQTSIIASSHQVPSDCQKEAA